MSVSSLVKKFWLPFIICTSIVIISFFSGFVFGLESTQSISAVLRKEVDLGDDFKFDMFLRSSVTLEAPEKVKAGENITWTFGLNPATIMLFLEVPSINQTFVTEAELSFEDSRPITVFDGVTLVIDLMPSANLVLTGPASLNQTNFVWDNFLEKQSYATKVFANASSKDRIVINWKFYLDAQISVYIKLQNFNSEIINHPIPTIEMSPQISRVIDVESTTTIIDTLGNPLVILALTSITTLTVISFFTIKRLRRKKVNKEIIGTMSEQKDVIMNENHLQKTNNFVYCIYCGEELPIQAVYCRKCGKAVT